MKDMTDILENAIFGLDGIEIKGKFIPVFSDPDLVFKAIENIDNNGLTQHKKIKDSCHCNGDCCCEECHNFLNKD